MYRKAISHRRNWTVFATVACLLVALALGVFVMTLSPTAPSIVILGEDFSNLHALESLKGQYEKRYGVKLDFIGDSFDTFNQKANQDLANGTGLHDVILHYSSVLHTFAGKGWVLTVPELKKFIPDANYDFENDLFPGVWKESSYFPVQPGGEPVPVGYPFAANTMVLVYNRTLFEDPARRAAYQKQHGEELSTPREWEQFRRIASFFTPADHSSYGVILQGASGSPLYWEWCNFAFGMGGGVMKKEYGWQSDKDIALILDSPETVAATQFYVDLKPYNYGDFFSTGQAEQQENMRRQKVAMAIMWSDSLYELINGPNGKDFGFAPIPGKKSMIGGGTFYINKKSRMLPQACLYVVRMMERKSQVELMKKGLCSAVKSAYDDPEVRKLPYVDAVRDSLARGAYMLEAGPDSGLIRDTIETALQRIWKGEESVDGGLRAAQQTIRDKRAQILVK